MERSKYENREVYIEQKLGDAIVTGNIADECLLSALTDIGEGRVIKNARSCVRVIQKDLDSFKDRDTFTPAPVSSEIYDIHVKGLERAIEELKEYRKDLEDFEYNVEVLEGSIEDLLYKLDYQRLSTGRPGEERKSLSY